MPDLRAQVNPGRFSRGTVLFACYSCVQNNEQAKYK